ncbi:hypothetical protein ILYODFUR_005034 [Ilyodon furcidens]|uniref:Uncharacterized protein n=1 Tax=Ilyodon furcidens TaxID=33524 RepID=A0ABV0U4L1_9TELE
MHTSCSSSFSSSSSFCSPPRVQVDHFLKITYKFEVTLPCSETAALSHVSSFFLDRNIRSGEQTPAQAGRR